MQGTGVGTDTSRFLEYCRVSRSLSEHTVLAYRQDLNEFAGFCAREGAAVPASAALVLGYVAFLQDRRGLKPATVRRRIACLRSFFRWQEKQDLIAASPFRQLDLSLRRPIRLPRALSRQQLAVVTRAASAGSPCDPACGQTRGTGHPVRDVRRTTNLAVRLMAVTGVRVGELTFVTLVDVVADGSAIRVSGKGSRERTVFVGNDRLRNDLRDYVSNRKLDARDTDRLFVNRRGNSLSAQCLRLRLRKISDDLGLSPRLTPHRLRHTAATLLLEEGVDIRFVQRLLGHSSISTTEIYTHVTDTSLKAVVERADPMGKMGI